MNAVITASRAPCASTSADAGSHSLSLTVRQNVCTHAQYNMSCSDQRMAMPNLKHCLLIALPLLMPQTQGADGGDLSSLVAALPTGMAPKTTFLEGDLVMIVKGVWCCACVCACSCVRV